VAAYAYLEAVKEHMLAFAEDAGKVRHRYRGLAVEAGLVEVFLFALEEPSSYRYLAKNLVADWATKVEKETVGEGAAMLATVMGTEVAAWADSDAVVVAGPANEKGLLKEGVDSVLLRPGWNAVVAACRLAETAVDPATVVAGAVVPVASQCVVKTSGEGIDVWMGYNPTAKER
jgi:hypothetical protein